MARTYPHCPSCGARFDPAAAWPRTCAVCARVSYLNPLPVVVLLLPVGDGVLCVRRGIPPKVGELALPGGFLDVGETWRQGMARELFEETGIRIDADEVELFDAHSAAAEGLLLLFGLARRRTAAELPTFVPNSEATGTEVLTAPAELAFPTHTQALRDFFRRRQRGGP
jgi:ADP-ribose pyrophosphatase YjhB (NUDIX family)